MLEDLKRAFGVYMDEMIDKGLASPFNRLELIASEIALLWVVNNYVIKPIGDRREPDGMPEVCVPSPAWYDQEDGTRPFNEAQDIPPEAYSGPVK